MNLLEREIYNHLIKVLRDYPNIERYVLDRETELRFPWRESDNNVGGGKSNVMTNTSELMAITIADDRRLTNLERNKKVVERCLGNADEDTVVIINELYIKQHPTLTIQGVAQKLNLSVPSVKRRRQRFLEDLREELGW
ncbi:transcriptional regulator [Lacticaseibacillus brantae]|uniref:transcriptional regulator n=1 Tax=Lacticaseibacillus brantae TaxID=943673 RepID=UPI001F203328|nr:transcriptional regulator [Lacticaseibacillus brantae]